MERRAFVVAMSALALASATKDARALGRTPLEGKLALHVPFSLASIDPHDLRDAAAAIFAPAIFDSLFTIEAGGIAAPALAQAMPAREGDGTIVRLREGLVTAHGARVDARDVIASIERARTRGAQAILADVPRPTTHERDAFAAVFPRADASRLARALASPLVAIVPRRFNPSAPDGTGAFRADITGNKLALSRNASAARGASFLDAIEIASAPDLTTSLRDFEAERDDLGWLGTGLHEDRKHAVRFDRGSVAVVALVADADTQPANAPGAIQKLVDAFPPERLAHLGLGALPSPVGDPGWTAQPCDLLVDERDALLVEVAKSIAPILSRAGHEVNALPVSASELAKRRAAKKAPLVVEAARPIFPGLHGLQLALASLESPASAIAIDRRPSKLPPSATSRSLTASLRVGVIGDVRIAGGALPDLVIARAASGEGWDLGATFLRTKR